ncbi:MAG TPA: DUF1499 domain-containing protein [Geminicoccaceae bacterium]|nr:DUF1499 domain-containing protein [Geminicoccaceae bacterium]
MTADDRAGPGREAPAEAYREAFPLPFDRLPLRRTPNQHLALPPGFASTAAPHGSSPIFDVGVERLAAAWRAVVAERPRVTLRRTDAASRQFEYVARSRVLRLPDVVTVQLVPLAPDRSSLAVYSRARYGAFDFGVNRRRVEAWLARLAELLADASHRGAG